MAKRLPAAYRFLYHPRALLAACRGSDPGAPPLPKIETASIGAERVTKASVCASPKPRHHATHLRQAEADGAEAHADPGRRSLSMALSERKRNEDRRGISAGSRGSLSDGAGGTALRPAYPG